MNSIEDKIKKRLDQYQSEIDPNEIWEGIQRKRHPKKDGRKIIFFMLAAIILLVLFVSLLITNKLNQNIDLHNENPIVNKETTNKQKTDKNVIKNTKNSLNHFSQKPPKPENESNNTISISNNTKNNNKSTNKITSDNPNKEKSETGNLVMSETLKQNNISSEYKNNKIVFLSIKTIISELKLKRKFNIKFSPVTYNKKQIRKFKPQIALELTPNYVYKQFILTSDNFASFMSNKQKSEKLLEAFDVSVIYRQNIYKGLGICTGINYGQIDTKMEFYYKENKDEEEDSILTTIVVNSITDTMRIYERAMIKKYYDVTEKIYNYHRYIRIPVLISYTGKIHNLNYNLRTGVNINILTFDKGRTLTPDGKTTVITDTKTNLLKPKAFGDFHFDLRFKYNLNNNLALNIGPQYKISILNLMQKNAGFKLYHHSFGINTGLNYSF